MVNGGTFWKALERGRSVGCIEQHGTMVNGGHVLDNTTLDRVMLH